MSRREFSKKVMAAAFQRANGKCEGCAAPLFPGRFEYDHRIPDAQGGEPTLENCDVLCKACHSAKTPKDVALIAKAKRVEAHHIGAHRPKAKIPGSKGTGFRKRMDGTVVRVKE